MKGITELDSVGYLRALNNIRKVAADFLTETQIMDIRKHMPVFTGKETAEEIETMKAAQIRKNLGEMLDSALENHPEATIRIMEAMIVYDDGEEHLKGAKLVNRAICEIMSEDVIGFFISLMKSGLIAQAN